MDNRTKILQCALELFAVRGYDGVGIQEIVDSSGITKPTLYHYFGNKEGLLTALFDEYFNRFTLKLRDAAVYDRDLPDSLDKIFSVYTDFAKTNSSFYSILLALVFAPPQSRAYQVAVRYAAEPFVILESLFIQAAQDHGNMKNRHRLYAASLIGMMNNFIALHLNGAVELNGKLKKRALHQFMYGIFS